MSTQIVDATATTGEAVESVDAEVVDIDQSLNPYIDKRDELEGMIRKFASYSASACAVRVITPEAKKTAVGLIRTMKSDRKDAVSFFRPMKQSIDRVKKTALSMEDHVLQLLDGPVAVLTAAVAKFDADVAAEQERRRQQLIEGEKRRLLEAQAKARQAAEEQAAHDEMLADVFSVEAPASSPEDVAPVLSDAQLTELAAASAPTEPEPEKVDGHFYVEQPHYEVTDIVALCKGVVDGVVPADCVTFVAGPIWRAVQRMKTDLGYPGVRVWVTKEPRTTADTSTDRSTV